MEELKLDEEALIEEPKKVVVPKEPKVKHSDITTKRNKNVMPSDDYVVPSCLRNERIKIVHIDRPSALVQNPKHALYGGMGENTIRSYCVPMLSNGQLVNVLTNDEKAFLEEYAGLEYNALSIYNKDEENFWKESNPNGISRVTLHKNDNYLDLSNWQDYIRYKILLANKDKIAPSYQAFEDYPKATYEFYIVSESEEEDNTSSRIKTSQRCWMEYGKIENDFDTLKHIVETMDGRTVSPNTKIGWLRSRVSEFIDSDAKVFLKIVTDPMLDTKVMINKAVQAGIISKRGTYYYMKEDNSPLCESGEEPVLNMAAKYLNSPKHQPVKLKIEALLNN